MSAILFVILLDLLAFTRGQAHEDGTCPTGFTPFGESCYAYMQGKMSWADAEQMCTVLHAHLPEIYTKEEQSFIQNFSRANGDHDVWLGAHDLIQEGLWVWAWSGSDLEMTAWGHGQPNDADNGREDCMELHSGSLLWNDEDCHHDKHYICQRSNFGASGSVIG